MLQYRFDPVGRKKSPPLTWRKAVLGGIVIVAVMAASVFAWEAGWVAKNIQMNDGTGKTVKTQTRTIVTPGKPSGYFFTPTANEVRLPDGTWADCHGDCEAVFRQASDTAN